MTHLTHLLMTLYNLPNKWSMHDLDQVDVKDSSNCEKGMRGMVTCRPTVARNDTGL